MSDMKENMYSLEIKKEEKTKMSKSLKGGLGLESTLLVRKSQKSLSADDSYKAMSVFKKPLSYEK